MTAGAEDYFRYLPVSPRSVQWGLYVTGVGCSAVPPRGAHPRGPHPELYQFTWEKGRVLPEFQVICLARGGGAFDSGPTGRRNVGAGDVVLLFPGVWHRYRPDPRTGWDSYWMGVNGAYLHGLMERGFIAPERAVLAVGRDEALVACYRRLLERVRADPAGNPLLLAADAMEVLARVLAPPGPERAGPATEAFTLAVEDRMVAEAVRFIWNQSARPMKAGDVAAALPVTRRSLERRFQRALGRTILEEINRCRMARVKRLLEETDLPLKRVAAAAGFSSAQRMTKVFHRLEGVSPAAYRRRSRGDGGAAGVGHASA